MCFENCNFVTQPDKLQRIARGDSYFDACSLVIREHFAL